MTVTSAYNFDEVLDWSNTDSAKHTAFGDDVIPLWVADMSFKSPQEVIDALKARVEQGVFGYARSSEHIKEVLVQRMADLYDWHIQAEDILYVPGVIAGFSNVIRACGDPGDNVLMLTPIYPPCHMAVSANGQEINNVNLTTTENGSRLHYEIDFDAVEAAINDKTKLFLHVSPHNPTGRVWTRDEQRRLAELCTKHDLVICSDEIHSDLIFSENKHIPIAALDPEIAKRTVTLIAPSKTYNIPSMGFSVVIIQDEALRKQYEKSEFMVVPHPTVLSFTAGLAAYEHGNDWLRAVMQYLEANRDFTMQFIEQQIPDLKHTRPEGTYLTWMDFRQHVPPQEHKNNFEDWVNAFMVEKAKVALTNGMVFHEGGDGFVRLNFATQRSLLKEGLERIRDAIANQ